MADSATAAEGDAADAGADIGSIDYRVEQPTPGGHIFLFQESEHPEGGILRTIAFRDVTVVPRGYKQIIDTKPDKAVTINLEMRIGPHVHHDINDLPLRASSNLDHTSK